MNALDTLGRPLRPDDPGTIGRYTTLRRLGSGGEGQVFLATSERTGPVALKLRRDRRDSRYLTCGEEFALARRVHPAATAAPIDHGFCESGPYLAMTLLADYQPLQPVRGLEELWRIAGATAQAIAAVHAAGIIHCDIKPGNFVRRNDDVRIIDFGIARDRYDQPHHDRLVYCSRGWAAPEQLHLGALTPAADVFAWGCLTAYLGTGENPYSAESEQEWMLRIRMTEPDLHGLPRPLATLVRAALDPDPHCRPTAAELADECHGRARSYSADRWDQGTRHLPPVPAPRLVSAAA